MTKKVMKNIKVRVIVLYFLCLFHSQRCNLVSIIYTINETLNVSMQGVHHRPCGMLKDNVEIYNALKILSLIFYIS